MTRTELLEYRRVLLPHYSRQMTTYKLKELDGGSVQLVSGKWRWYTIRINSLPENICESQYLFFANESEPGGVMRTYIASEIDTINEALAVRYATHPDQRSFRIGDERYDVYPPSANEDEPMWKVRRQDGRQYQTSFAIEKPLGELTFADLRDIATVSRS